MAFDSGMLACTLSEIRKLALGARIEKVYQPERDEIVIQMRSIEGEKRLLINAGSNNPRIGFSAVKRENPQNPPMFCMLLRKYLQGSRLVSVEQASFDRIAILEFAGYDEMGFECRRFLIAELMGRYSNLIYADKDKKIVSALKTLDISNASERQILPGMTYKLPDARGKLDPFAVSREDFFEIYEKAPEEKSCEKLLISTFMGFSPAVAREIVFRATRHTDTPVKYASAEEIYEQFSIVLDVIKSENFEPTLVYDGATPVEYAFLPLTQYTECKIESFESAGALLDAFFGERDKEQRVRQRASDILKLLTNAEARLSKKLELQRAELVDCEKGSEYKKIGDLITANIYKLSRGDKTVVLDDYESYDEDGNFARITVQLDSRLSPSANAQRYYKKYTKARNAKLELAKQIELGEAELQYIYTVFDSLTRAETPTDLLEIRDELYRSGYASRMKNYHERKAQNPTVMKFVTEDGMKILCGKNNLQNEYITHKLAEKSDYWFHVKNMPGSHVLLVTEGKEPTDLDFTRAAEVAAYYSKAEGANIAVDYTLAKNVKKVPSGKPGLVIYHTNWTAYVTPDEKIIQSMRK
ncbi:MAG: NFACT family protein [Clostridia bacterium]|nr:NFACT family protein [Clostridia bacterium]